MTPEPIAARRAGLYMRISRDQTGEALGVGRQEDDCRALANQLGWEVAEVYVDNDISATSGKPRPAYRKMLADLEAGAIDAIIAWHPDRLYRRAVDLSELVEAVQRNRTPVATAKAGDIDLNSPTGLLVAELLGAIAMYEVRHKSERWRRSHQQRREAGLPARTGSRLFGYTHEMQVVDHERAIAKAMAAKIRSGDSALSVVRWLHDQGVVGTRGRAWTAQAIKKYLTNPRVAGYSTLDGEIVATGEWAPIIDKDTFEVVCAVFTARTKSLRPRVALLPGLLFCACGQRMITSSNKGKRTYRCPKQPATPGCGKVSCNAAPIEEFVEGYAEQLLSDPRVRANIARLRTHPAEQLAEINALELRVVELEAQLAEPGVAVAALMRAITTAKGRREQLAGILAARGSVALPAVGEAWPEDLLRRRALVDLVVSRVNLNPAAPGWSSHNGFDTGRVEIVDR